MSKAISSASPSHVVIQSRATGEKIFCPVLVWTIDEYDFPVPWVTWEGQPKSLDSFPDGTASLAAGTAQEGVEREMGR